MQLPFPDRDAAGRALAARLRQIAGQVPAGTAHDVVVALPRGGVPVGLAVSRALGCAFDIRPVRKLGMPLQPELAFGALAVGGFRWLDEPWVQLAGLAAEDRERIIAREQQALDRREARYRLALAPMSLTGRTVWLVDDGIATGATMQAALSAIRAEHPAHVQVAVPVASAEALSRIEAAGTPVLSLHVPEPFHSVGQWYERFPTVSDEEVLAMLQAARAERPSPVPA